MTHLEKDSLACVRKMISEGYLLVGSHYYYEHKKRDGCGAHNRRDVQLLDTGEWAFEGNRGNMIKTNSISALARLLYKVFTTEWKNQNGWKKIYFKAGPYKYQPLELFHDFYRDYRLRKRYPEDLLQVMKKHKEVTKALKQYAETLSKVDRYKNDINKITNEYAVKEAKLKANWRIEQIEMERKHKDDINKIANKGAVEEAKRKADWRIEQFEMKRKKIKDDDEMEREYKFALHKKRMRELQHNTDDESGEREV